MNFDIFHFVICLLECATMLLFVSAINDTKSRKKDYIVTYILMSTGSIVITFIDNLSYPLLIINFLILFLSFCVGFRKSLKENFFNALFSFLLLLYFQSLTIIFLPIKLIVKNAGNILGDSLIFIISLLLSIFSSKYRWAEHYRKNINIVWTLLGTLCIPEIVIAQYFAIQYTDSSRQTIIIIVLLQIVYVTSIISVLSIINHRSNYNKFLQTQKHIEALDRHLDFSRQSIHDFNKHIRYIHNLVITNSDNDSLKNEVDAYCKKLMTVYDDEEILLQLDSPIFRALLYGRRSQATKNGIEFILDATPILPNFPIENFKLVEIFDNLIDNAFECVEKLQSSNKWIKVSLAFEQKDIYTYHKLIVQNPYDEIDISKILNSKAYTTKGKSHMGVGINKVSRLVSDTGGDLIISTDNNIFSVSIIYKANKSGK